MHLRKKGIVRIALILLILAVGVSLVWAGGKAEGKGKKAKVLGIVLTMDHSFMQDVATGFGYPIEGWNIDLAVQDPKADAAQQVSIIETYLNQGIDALIFYPIDSKALAPVVAEARKKGVYVVTEGNRVAGENVYIGWDFAKIGAFNGEGFATWWKKNRPGVQAKILVIDIPKIQEPQKMATFFVPKVKEMLPDAVIVVQQDGEGSQEKGMEVTTNVLQAHPEINAIYAINDAGAVGALAACQTLKRNDIAIFGDDGSFADVIAKGDGKSGFVQTTGLSPLSLGMKMMETAIKLISGEKLPAVLDMSQVLINKDNVEQYIAEQKAIRDKIAAAEKK